MRLKFTLTRPGGDSVDLAATVDSTTSVGELAAMLERCDPAAPRHGRADPATSTDSSTVTLRLHPGSATTTGTVLSAGLPLAASGLSSGSTVSVAVQSERFQTAGADRGPAAATVRVLSGPDSGREFPLAEGSSYLGRNVGSEVRLSDSLVSKRHARINVTDIVEIIDVGSANGLLIGGSQVQRAVLRPQDRVIVGDTAISITSHRPVATGPVLTTDIDFNRSPRLDPTFAGETFVAPDPPELPRRARFPIIASVAPLIMGGVMFALTHSVLSIVFVALSPLLMIANYVDQRVQSRRHQIDGDQQFSESVRVMRQDIVTALAREQAGRLAETPSATDALDAIARQTSLLWTRRTEHERFLTARLGTGTQPSRHAVELPGRNRTSARHWQALASLQRSAALVDGVPVVADLVGCGSVGIGGIRGAAVGVARAVVVQVVALHSPADLTVAAITSSDSAPDWAWLKWLPHVGGPYSPLARAHLGSDASVGSQVIADLEELVQQRLQSTVTAAIRPVVVVVVEDDAPVDRARLVGLAENGPEAGVHLVWVGTSQERLPAACRTFLSLDGVTGEVTAGFVRTALGVNPVVCETVDRERALAAARALSPVVDSGARIDDDSDLPASTSLLGLVGSEIAEDPAAVVDRWRESQSIVVRDGSASPSRRSGSLRATIGQAAGEPMVLDLRTQGPHALVGGTTGAGKSEFLQTWVLAMAAGYSPDTLTFLFVDYKGGSAFADCINLPHSVGQVTDLTPHLVRRALTSLNAELRYRERILNNKKAKDLLELQRRGDPDVPPSLIIVVDEFAALVQEVPEFVDGVVNVAQRGRSLGLHLILATQRPTGVIKDNLRANTTLRIALRMSDEADSMDVLGTPLAAGFSPEIPGRGAAKTGPGRITGFQTAYVGGWTSPTTPPPPIDIQELTFGAGRRWEEPADLQPVAADTGPTDIERITRTILAAALAVSIPTPRKPWLPELADVYDLQFLSQRSDTYLTIGVGDDPDQQEQRTVYFNPDTDGNMAIYGTGGSGKSTALRTLAIAAGITPRSGPCDVYGLDFGSAGLRMLESLPHVGSIISGDDHERVARLLRWLRREVDERSERFAAVRAGTITEYRTITENSAEARILVLVDGMAAFRNEYELTSRMQMFTNFTQIAADGRPVGIHVIVTADRPSTVPSALNSTIQRRLVLRLADEMDYLMLDTPADALNAKSPPGRGVLDGLDLQVAVLGGGMNVAHQSRAVDQLARSLSSRRTVAAAPIRRLPEIVRAGDLPSRLNGKVVIGMADDDLGPVGIEPAGIFLLAGAPGSGRTTSLASIAAAVVNAQPGAAAYYLGNKRSPLPGLLHWKQTAITPEAVDTMARELTESLRTAAPSVVVVEGLADFLSGPADLALQDLLKMAKVSDHFLIADSDTSLLSQSWPLIQSVRSGRRGLALQPEQSEGDSIFRTSFPRLARAEFTAGRGLLVEGGKTRRLQICLPE